MIYVKANSVYTHTRSYRHTKKSMYPSCLFSLWLRASTPPQFFNFSCRFTTFHPHTCGYYRDVALVDAILINNEHNEHG
jgi:hypothetical protein